MNVNISELIEEIDDNSEYILERVGEYIELDKVKEIIKKYIKIK